MSSICHLVTAITEGYNLCVLLPLGFIINLFLFVFCSNSLRNHYLFNCIIIKAVTNPLWKGTYMPPFLNSYINIFIDSYLPHERLYGFQSHDKLERRWMIAGERTARLSTDMTTAALHWGPQQTVIRDRCENSKSTAAQEHSVQGCLFNAQIGKKLQLSTCYYK